MTGPDRVGPGLSPGGTVMHVYDDQGALLVVQLLVPTEDPQLSARAAAMVTLAAASRHPTLVCYDGDTGLRIEWFDRMAAHMRLHLP